MSERQNEEIFDGIDLNKIKSILRKSAVWIIAIFALFNTASFLYIRYTKPLFESSSVLKLDIQSESNLIGVSNPLESPNLSSLSGEIELLRSNLFMGIVVDAVGMDVSYHYYGRYLTDERYKNSPFAVSYKLHNSSFYDFPIDVEILSNTSFILEYGKNGGSFRQQFNFGEPIATADFNLLVEKTENFSPSNSLGKYYFTINSREKLVSYLQGAVTVQPLNFNAKTITVSLKDYNRHKARELVHAIDTLYLKYTKEIKNQALEQKIKFVDNQIKATEAKLEGYEYYFENFTIENRTINLQNDLAKTINVLERLDSSLYHTENRLQAIKLISRQLAKDEPLSISPFSYRFFPEFINSALQQYRELQIEREKLLASYNENTFVVQRKDAEMKNLAKDLLELIDGYQATLAENKGSIEKQKKNLEGSFVNLPSMGTEYNKQRRFYNLQESFYVSLIQSKAELEIARAGTVTNFIILSPASSPGEPIHPKNLIIYGVGLALSIIISVVFLGVRYLLSTEITGLVELEHLTALPILGTIPKYAYEKKNNGSQIVIHKNPKSAISEAMRTIRTNMDFMKIGGKDKKVISISSTISGEGKTFVTVNLAGIIALSQYKVIILDLDLRKAKVHLAFGHEKSEKGISTLLIGRHNLDECIRKTEIPNLDYIPVGPLPPNPSELLLSADYDQLLSSLKEKYDFIIMDTPPVGLVTDGILVMKKADLPLYILRAEYSQREFVKSINKMVQLNQFNNIALILNGARKSEGYGYGYGHGYYEEMELPNKKWWQFPKQG